MSDHHRHVLHLDTIASSILSDSPREQAYDHLVGNCVVANGCFDILHRGHLDLLRELDYEAHLRGRLRAIVAINSDESVRRLKGDRRPNVPQESRSYLLTHLQWPFTVVIFEEDTPQRLMDLLKPRAVVKGSEYPPDSVIRWMGNEYSKGSEVVSVGMVPRYSTTILMGVG